MWPLKIFVRNWRFFIIVWTPLILLPLLFLEAGEEAKKFKCLFVIILMATYWCVEALPLAVTSFIPVVLFPLLGVQDTGAVTLNYMRETNMMFVGGLIIAMAVEFSGLHKRIALKVILAVGISPKRLLFGIMVTTMGLSMWISNTATTAMMVPIVLSVLSVLNEQEDLETVQGSQTVPPAITDPKTFSNDRDGGEDNVGFENTEIKSVDVPGNVSNDRVDMNRSSSVIVSCDSMDQEAREIEKMKIKRHDNFLPNAI